MIKAVEQDACGRRTIIIGLTPTNLDRLVVGSPIRIHALELGVVPSFQIWVLGGNTLVDIAEDLRCADMDIGGPPAAASEEGMLRHYGPWWGMARRFGGPVVDVAVFGVTALAARALREGATFGMPVPGRAVGVRLLAGADTDALAARIAAGRTADLMVDMRGGRTD